MIDGAAIAGTALTVELGSTTAADDGSATPALIGGAIALIALGSALVTARVRTTRRA